MKPRNGQENEARGARGKQEGRLPVDDPNGARVSRRMGSIGKSEPERTGGEARTGRSSPNERASEGEEASTRRLRPRTHGKTLRSLIEDCNDQLSDAQEDLQRLNRRIERLQRRREEYQAVLKDWEQVIRLIAAVPESENETDGES
ncbi:hypothetical protein [Leptolyngbya sp. FACHB-261]|uniref:hypothetical protein n=1 Tax=Leptolyngbya sp. FACHB-261 TaxID=2692806 RepID=UPI00168372AF|nr:hypothetical protein [Leptolyngbya sp. FACHB-261]MBD2100281.1 hypothetical protein [Leptolyngbya sp. FACHB-261]